MTPERLAVERPVATGRAAAWLAKQVELALAECELSLPQYRVLALLGEGSAMSSSLADRLAVRPPSVTAIADGLVSRGLVTRKHAEDDRRQVAHGITAEGARVLATADAAVDRRLGDVARCLGDPAETARALDGLSLWGRALREHHAARTAK